MEQRSGVHLIGGGWDPAALASSYGAFLAEAGADPRIACLVVDEGDGPEQFERWSDALDSVARCRPFPVLVPVDGQLAMSRLDDADGLLICGGLTPAYAAAVAPVADLLREWLADRPYCGFSAGAAIAARTAITGGWLLEGRPVTPEDAGEDLTEVTMVPGLGLVQFAVDVHCAQWGTLPRLLAACQTTGVDGCALDEDTRLTVRGGCVEVAGSGYVYLARRADSSVTVRRFAAGDRFELGHTPE